jgi:hypothetical protein
MGAITHQLAQLPLRQFGNETGLQQSVLQQFGDPLRIFHIAFATGYELNVLGIDQ